MATLSIKSEVGPAYQLKCLNNSTTPWIFYIFQRKIVQTKNEHSTAWLASPFKIVPTAYIRFEWTADLSFVWSANGVLNPGVIVEVKGNLPCRITEANQTTFSVVDNTPRFSPAEAGGLPGCLTIIVDGSVPNGKFSSGVGMSGHCTSMVQAQMLIPQIFTLPSIPGYYIAVADQMQMGEVLPANVMHAQQFQFPLNVFSLTATLQADNTWTMG